MPNIGYNIASQYKAVGRYVGSCTYWWFGVIFICGLGTQGRITPAVLASLAWVPGSIPGKCRDSTGGLPTENHPTHLCDRTPLVSAAQAL